MEAFAELFLTEGCENVDYFSDDTEYLTCIKGNDRYTVSVNHNIYAFSRNGYVIVVSSNERTILLELKGALKDVPVVEYAIERVVLNMS